MVCMSDLNEGSMRNKKRIDSLNYFNDTVFLTPVYCIPNKSFYLSKRRQFRRHVVYDLASTSYSKSNESIRWQPTSPLYRLLPIKCMGDHKHALGSYDHEAVDEGYMP